MFTILRGLYYFPPFSSKLDQSLLYDSGLDFVALYSLQESITHNVYFSFGDAAHHKYKECIE